MLLVKTSRNLKEVVIVTLIWQKLSSIEREVTLIVRNFWQLFSRIFGETSLIVTNIWRNQRLWKPGQMRLGSDGYDRLSGLRRITSWFPGLLVVIQDVSNGAPRCRRSWWRN